MNAWPRLFGLVCLLFVLISNLPVAAQQASPCSLARFSDDTAALKAAADGANAKAGSDTVVLCDETRFVFDESGKYVRTDYLSYKVLTQGGAENWDSLAVRWEPWHQDKPSVRARVLSPDGGIHALDLKTIKDDTASDAEQKVYSDGHALRGPLPAIAPGAIVEQEFVITEHEPEFKDGLVERSYFGGNVPVEETRLFLDVPSSTKLNFQAQLLPDLRVEKVDGDGRLRVTFRQARMGALEDIPPNLPSDTPWRPAVTFSTGKDWQSIASMYAGVLDRQFTSANLQGPLSSVLNGKQTREEKLGAILQFLSREIRYTGVEFGDSAIVPQLPAEVLKRKYGDCKDKASLMVAMLRAAGISAYVALLNAGSRQDVPPDLPGMGMFDHAIVYVPGDPPYWMDVTDEYGRLGQLPYPDQGRYSLIVRNDADGLVKTPESKSEENLVSITREFRLAENGPARVAEITEPHGTYESIFRAYYADAQNKDLKKNVADYIKDTFLSDDLGKIERSDPQNLSQQFKLTLEANKAKRGVTELDRAVVAIRLEGLFHRLPEDLREEEEDKKNRNSPEELPKKSRTQDYQLPNVFVTEWTYRIVPPLGFLAVQLPASQKEQLGPASYSQEFRVEADGAVTAVLRFDTGKRRLTAGESKELQKSVLAMQAKEPILVWFEPKAAKLREEGKMKESMEAYRELVGMHPKEALHHLQLAKALLDAGSGNGARAEAQLAVKLEPSSALAEKTLAEILEYDLVGRKMRPGSDYTGAEGAYRAAMKLDPENKANIANLAILLEYDHWGLRYGPAAKLKEALIEYRKLSKDELQDFGISNNVAFALFYSGQFAEAQKEARNLNPQPVALLIASTAALAGTPAALAEAHADSPNEEGMQEALKTAGQMLVNVRMYGLGADLMKAGAGGKDASDVAADALLFKDMQPYEKRSFPNDPSGVALKLILLENKVDLTAQELREICSKNGTPVVGSEKQVSSFVQNAKRINSSKAREGNFPDVGIDLSLTRAAPKQEGNDGTGYKVVLWGNATYKESIYVVKEDGKYKVLATSKHPEGIALEVLDRVKAGDLTGARVLLDWLRQDVHLAIDDDPLSGDMFPRLWTIGKAPDAASMRVAAAALICNGKDYPKLALEMLATNPLANPTEMEKSTVLLVKLTAHAWLLDSKTGAEISRQLYEQYPESKKAFLNLTFHLRVLGKYDEIEHIVAERAQRLPNDPSNMRALALNALDRGDYQKAHDLIKQLALSGNGDAWDLNNLVWYALYTEKVTASDLDDGVRAAELTKKSAGVLHTLGCAYAEIGRLKEAKDVLLQAMDILDFDEPEDNYWYAFGRIAEQYGQVEIASGDYNKVKKPEYDFQMAQSPYKLAQIRLAALSRNAALERSPILASQGND